MYAVFYKKQNGEVIIRKRSTLPPYAIGGCTSMGWKILDIKYVYNGNYYNGAEYRNLTRPTKKKKPHLRKFALWLLRNNY